MKSRGNPLEDGVVREAEGCGIVSISTGGQKSFYTLYRTLSLNLAHYMDSKSKVWSRIETKLAKEYAGF